MSYQHIIDVLERNSNDSCPTSYFHNLVKNDADHPGFIKVQNPFTNYTDYIKEVDEYIVVLADSDQWCEGPDDDGWTYAVFNSIEDYTEEVYGSSNDILLCDEGYSTFDNCFKSAVFDILQNCH